jgi:hypothetical protein
VAYSSRQLKVHEQNYPIHDLELGAVVHALEALSVWAEMRCLHKPQESEVHIHSVGAEYEATKMVGVDQRL